MKSKIYTHIKKPRFETPNFTTAPAQGMFRSRPFEVQAQTAEKSQPKPDLKTSLMRAERYGHNLSRMHPASQSAAAKATPEKGQVVQRTRKIAPQERANREEFIAARAHLAAGLHGAPLSGMKKEVDLARGDANRWEGYTEPIAENTATEIYERRKQEDYKELKRFQDKEEHYKPRSQTDKTAFDQVKDMHRTETGDSIEPLHSGNALIGARHTAGHVQDSPFVSLLSDPSKLKESTDDSKGGAQEIANKAKKIHTYTIPKQYTWNTEKMKTHLGAQDGMLDEQMEGQPGVSVEQWLNSVPEKEGEELFLGGDLNKYYTSQMDNPYRPKNAKKKKKK